MTRALVTRGTGFVGASLVRRLVEDGHDVHLLVRPGHARWRLSGIADRVTLHPADLCDPGAVRSIARRVEPGWVFHLAVYGAYPAQADLDRMVDTNIRGTINLVRACLETGFESLVHTGSSSEYGYKDHAPSESEALEPNSHYALTKATSTMFVSFTARSAGVNMPTLRLYSVYGPYEEPSRLIPTVVVEGLQGRLPPLVHPGVARDFVHVDDVTEAYVRAASAGRPGSGAVYNVGSGRQSTIAEVVDVARARFGIETEPRWGSMPERSWDTSTWVSDPARIQAELGWSATISLAEGLDRFAAWFEADPARVDLYRRHRAWEG